MSADGRQSPVLWAIGLKKEFYSGGRKISVLRGVDIQLPRGESVSIRGESGSGKSTLLNILAGIESPDLGTVLWAGESIGDLAGSALNCKRARFLGFVFQSYYLIPELTALENVILAGRIAGQPMRLARERALELLERLGLSERLHSHPEKLSGGERQRAAIARALLNEPSMVFADEPTGNLDEKTAGRVMEELFAVVRDYGASLLLVTHNPAFAKLTDASLLLHEGLLVCDSKQL
jgi:ABC-type lipoprotein export system ATPase subunit